MWWNIDSNKEEIAELRKRGYEDYELEEFYLVKLLNESKLTEKKLKWKKNYNEMIKKYGDPTKGSSYSDYSSEELWNLQNTEKIVYCITNLANNKKYIGKTKTTFNLRYKGRGAGVERVYNHMVYNSSGNQHLLNSIIKYGLDSFRVDILCTCESDLKKKKKERYFIDLYKSNQEEYGYNKTDGGDGVEVPCKVRFNNLMVGVNTKKLEGLIVKGVTTFEEIVDYTNRPVVVVYKNGKDSGEPYHYKTLRTAINGIRKPTKKKHGDYIKRGEMIMKLLLNHDNKYNSLPRGKSYVEVYLLEDYERMLK